MDSSKTDSPAPAPPGPVPVEKLEAPITQGSQAQLVAYWAPQLMRAIFGLIAVGIANLLAGFAACTGITHNVIRSVADLHR